MFNRLDNDGNDPNSTTLTNLFSKAIFITLVLYFLAVVLPTNLQKNTSDGLQVGDLRIEMYWSLDYEVDLDLWVKTPNDDHSVGYSRRNGTSVNLLRDDLGYKNDAVNTHFEMIASHKKLAPGEYIINVYFYSDRRTIKSDSPIPINVVIVVKEGANVFLIKKNLTIAKEGTEKTVVRFTVDSNGKVDRNSIIEFPVSIAGK